MKNLLICFFLVLLTGCSHGPTVTVYSSNPLIGGFTGADKSGAVPNITYAQSVGFAVYAPQDEQSLLDYCEARTTDGTAPPQFAKCSTDLANQGFDCVDEACVVNGFQNGAICTPGASSFVSFADSTNYLAFSPADNTTLLAYCNVSIEDQ